MKGISFFTHATICLIGWISGFSFGSIACTNRNFHPFLSFVGLDDPITRRLHEYRTYSSLNKTQNQSFQKPCPSCFCSHSYNVSDAQSSSSTKDERDEAYGHFPTTLSKFFPRYGTVSRDEFTGKLDIGVPLDPGRKGADVLVLYPSDKALPAGNFSSGTSIDAVEKCETVKVVLTQRKPKECLAIVPQWESYTVHKFMRLPKGPGHLHSRHPLRYVSRAQSKHGENLIEIPPPAKTNRYYCILEQYLRELPTLIRKLEDVLRDIATPSKSVVVQVCNYGQAQLFHNFACSAKARGIQLKHTIMFATDQATYDLCQKLGITAFYDENVFKDFPTEGAERYGDETFSRMMLAKVFCVQLALAAGYNVLFQDVDVVWYQEPLSFLENSTSLQEWDLIFQDDGSRTDRYAPFSPNTGKSGRERCETVSQQLISLGFYYVRFNDRTHYLMSMLLRNLDTIGQSHQGALTALLNDHVSRNGLRVKVIPKGESNIFPGGYEFHSQKDFMRRLVQRQLNPAPFVFHMSWTGPKEDKKRFLEQLGEWYLRDGCMKGYACCLPEPTVTCHYRDKPSVIPCSDSPSIGKGQASFWS